MNPTILSLLVKVKELADRGVAGERQAAIEKLKLLMAKYKITLADLEKVQQVILRFKYRTFHEKILGIILAQHVCGSHEVPCRVLPKRTILIYLTSAQKKEWHHLWAHFLPCLRREERLFLPAFLHRQEIQPPPGGKSRSLSPAEITAILSMMRYMDRDPVPRTERLLSSALSGLSNAAPKGAS